MDDSEFSLGEIVMPNPVMTGGRGATGEKYRALRESNGDVKAGQRVTIEAIVKDGGATYLIFREIENAFDDVGECFHFSSKYFKRAPANSESA